MQEHTYSHGILMTVIFLFITKACYLFILRYKPAIIHVIGVEI